MTIDDALTGLKSAENLGRRNRAAWKMLRRLVPAEKRFYFEGHPKIPGQLWYRERIQLSQVIKEFKPESCFEIGTWKGGGSTFFIANALWKNGIGKLHTIEIDRSFYLEAKENFSRLLPSYAPRVEFHFGDYREVYGRILRETDYVDFVILDGPEDGQETMSQYNFFLPHMRPGTILMAHDWYSEKSRLLKGVIENNPAWEIKRILSPPDSVGLMIAVRKWIGSGDSH